MGNCCIVAPSRALLNVLLVLLLGVTGCSPSLANVRVYAEGLQSTEDQVAPIASDTYDSCLRLHRYGLLRIQLFDSSPGPVEEYNKAVVECRKWVGLAESYRAYHAIVLVYAEALLKMTEDEAVDYGAAAKELAGKTNSAALSLTGKSLDALTKQGFQESATNVAAAVARWGTQTYREKQVGEAILEAGPSVAIILHGLRFVLHDVYLTQLDLEADSASTLYRLMRTKPYGALADVQWHQLQVEVKARRQTAAALAKTLERLEVATLALVQTAEKKELDTEALLAEVKPLLRDILRVDVAAAPPSEWDAPTTMKPPPCEAANPSPPTAPCPPAAGAAPPAPAVAPAPSGE